MGEQVVETVLHGEVAKTSTSTVPVRVARLERFVVRERRTVDVEVAHEEFRVVYDDLDVSVSVPVSGDRVRSVTTVLHEERVEVVRRVVPVERVTLVVVPVAGSAEIAVQIAHEELAVDEGDPAPSRPSASPRPSER